MFGIDSRREYQLVPTMGSGIESQPGFQCKRCQRWIPTGYPYATVPQAPETADGRTDIGFVVCVYCDEAPVLEGHA